ncbi:hypothetical protein [Paraburkholderia kirstenboschensis]|uniref:Uncharacterized protein n=1 Tax=Paraburkholderia kirstenboschensis TaxID=1245436 RepID=A0ABZ0E920_9BURK|nr:hypothetical protein [Paraburkholderia kirstenboschensis]WOD13751.1 hypothetical protein RW095_07240 [Paraburkholderia kirstenboschensis]
MQPLISSAQIAISVWRREHERRVGRSANIPGGVAVKELIAAFAAEALAAAILRTLKIGSQNKTCGSRERMPEERAILRKAA